MEREMLKLFQDVDGLYHHIKNPNSMSSENSPLFTALVLTMKKELGLDVKKEAEYALYCFYIGAGKFANYSSFALMDKKLPFPKNISHDNYLGIMCLHKLAGKKFDLYFDKRAMMNPVRFCTFLFLQCQWLLPCFLVWFLATSYSMLRKWKHRDHGVFPAADNKQLTWVVCKVFKLNKCYKWFSWLLSKNSLFEKWTNVFSFYYRCGHSPTPDHPCIVLSRTIYNDNSVLKPCPVYIRN